MYAMYKLIRNRRGKILQRQKFTLYIYPILFVDDKHWAQSFLSTSTNHCS